MWCENSPNEALGRTRKDMPAASFTMYKHFPLAPSREKTSNQLGKSRQLGDLREEPHELVHGCRASAITACLGEYTQLATLTILPLSLRGHKGDRWANTSYLPFALPSSACCWCLTVGNHLPSTLEEEFLASLQAQYLPLFAPHFLFPKLAPESFLCINSRHCVNTVLRFTSTRLFQLQLSSQIDFLSHKFETCTV